MTSPRSASHVLTRALALLPVLGLVGCGSPDEKAQAYYESGMALIAKKDDVAARLELLNAVKYKADKVEVWKALAGVDERTKSTLLFGDLRRVVELDPNDLGARLKLARIMVSGGAAEAASKVLEAAKEGDTPNADLHALKAVLFARTNDPAAAVREAQRAISIDPANIDAANILAAKKATDGDLDGALRQLESLNGDDARVEVLKIQIFLRKGDLVQAEALIRQLIAQKPDTAAYRAQLIQLLVSQRRFDDAEKEFRARVAIEPNDSKVALDLVRFLAATKGAAPAQAELETRIKAGGDVFDYQMALADLQISQNKPDDAAKALQGLVTSASTPERKTAAKLKLAELDVGRGNLTAGEPLIAELLAADRRNAGALRLRASIAVDRGQIDSAVADLREALNEQPKSPDLLMLLALAYERGGKPELAERQYADAMKSSNSDPTVALRFVAFMQRRGDAARAEDILTEAVTRTPANLELLSSLAQVRLSRKNWTGAQAVADAMTRVGNDRGLAEQVRAAALAGQDKIGESIAALEAAHKEAPDSVQPVVSLVSAYIKQGEPAKATALLDEMNRKFPANAQLLVLTGQAMLLQNKDDEALRSFKQAVVQQPKNPIGYTALSELYSKQRNFDAAADALAAGLREQPDNLNFRLALAGMQIQKGSNDAAIAQYEAILKDQPRQAVAVNNLVSLLLDFRADPESLKRARSLADQLKGVSVPQFQDTYGWAQYKSGEFAAAVATLEGAAAKLPELAAVHYHLGMSYKATGAQDKADEQFRIAAGIEPEGTPLRLNINAAMSGAK